MAHYAKDVLVAPKWLEAHLTDDSIRIVEVDENPGLYREAHIPGAIGLDWKTDLQDEVKGDFLGPEEFGRLFGSRGISDDHLIVLYGDRNNWFAAYTYWYLKYYGHEKVKLLNGPRDRWISEGRPTSTEVPNYPPVTFNAKPGNDSIRANRNEVFSAVDAQKIVEVRVPEESSLEPVSMGRDERESLRNLEKIPAAAAVPWGQAVREDGAFKSAGELRRLFREEGILSDEPVIAYSRLGAPAAHTWFVLHELLGKTDVKNYDGSWLDWDQLASEERAGRGVEATLEAEQTATSPTGESRSDIRHVVESFRALQRARSQQVNEQLRGLRVLRERLIASSPSRRPRTSPSGRSRSE